MAGTDDDNTTPDGLRLTSAELAFVTELVGSEERAIEVMDSLRDDLAKGLIRWICTDLTVRGDLRANPSLRSMLVGARGATFLWERNEESHTDVDWPKSYLAWAGPLSGFVLDNAGGIWPTFDPGASTHLIASGIKLHHGDVVARLVARGLMPPALPPPPPPEPTAPIEDASEPSSAAVVSASATTARQRVGSQEQWIAPAALEIFGEDLPLLAPAELKRAIESRLRAKTLKTSVPLDWKVDWGACKRFLRKKGKLRSAADA